MTNRFQYSVNRKLDLVVTIDDSPGMRPLQGKLARQLPDLIRVLAFLPDGLPDLHIAVVSTSMGAGRFADVPGCGSQGGGDSAGKFVHPQSCVALAGGHSFIIANGAITNFTGDLGDLFSCMANVGTNGCTFSQPFKAIRRALEKAAEPLDPDNGGFLRHDATLAILLLTNQDDCSVPEDSDLFDPGQMTLADAYGGLHPYRCVEFGHRCGGGIPPPHDLPAGVDRVALEDCAPAEDPGHLARVLDFVDFLRGLKPNAPEQLFVSAVAGPGSPYLIERTPFITATGDVKSQPALRPSCMGTSGEHGSPSLRVKKWLDAFGGNSAVLESICADDLRPVLSQIARPIHGTLSAQCIAGSIATRPDGTPDCQVVVSRARRNDGDVLPYCDAHQANYPCWRLSSEMAPCVPGQSFRVCSDPTCTRHPAASGAADVVVTCSLLSPC